MAREQRKLASIVAADVVGYCHQKRLPMLTTLVVGQSDGVLSEKAVERICEECAKLGIDVGPDRRVFLRKPSHW